MTEDTVHPKLMEILILFMKNKTWAILLWAA